MRLLSADVTIRKSRLDSLPDPGPCPPEWTSHCPCAVPSAPVPSSTELTYSVAALYSRPFTCSSVEPSAAFSYDFPAWYPANTLAAISTWASFGTISGGISTRSSILMPVLTIASCFMSLIEMKRWILVTPSQCKTSGIRTWKRVSVTPATSFVQLKYSEALSPPSWRLRMLYTKYFVTSPNARPSLRKYTQIPVPPFCAVLMHSSIACVKYGLHVQISEPNTSLPLHSSCTRQVSSTDSSGIFSGSPQM
mmetsp:Transcript_61963/g.202094  ORF Transcript_61963/g.202094 Transcript_61963/m.202094 type:complete len:250 (-) Transcript_61963:2336-3085(-)